MKTLAIAAAAVALFAYTAPAYAFLDNVEHQLNQDFDANNTQQQGQQQRQGPGQHQSQAHKQTPTFKDSKNYNAPGGIALGASSFGTAAENCIVTMGSAWGIGGATAVTGNVTGGSGLFNKSATYGYYNALCGADNAARDLERVDGNAALVAHCMNPF